MTLPVSIYEALLVQVREITNETILLQQQLSSDLFHNNVKQTDDNHNLKQYHNDDLFDDKQEKIHTGSALNDEKYFTFHQRSPGLETVPESCFDAEDLAAKLITWQNYNHQDLHQTQLTEVENKEEAVALRHRKQLETRNFADKLLDIVPTSTHTERGVGVVDFDVGSVSKITSSVSQTRRLGQREDQTPHLHYYIKDPPLANQIENPQINLRDNILTNKNTNTVINKQRYSTNTPTLLSNTSNSECFNSISSSGREFLRLYKGINKNVMKPAKDLQQKSIGHDSELFARTGKCYEEDASSEEDIKADSSSCTESQRLSPIYHGTWPTVKRDTWTAQSIGNSDQKTSTTNSQNEIPNVMSYSSSSGCSTSTPGNNRRLDAKVDVVYSLLGMLSSTEGRDDMTSTLLAMSNSIDSCLVMRQSGVLPLLVQLIHAPGQDPETRERASRALHNVIIARNDEKIGRRESRVLRLLEQLRDYCQLVRVSLQNMCPIGDVDRHPGSTIAALMKLSFDEAHRSAMCQLGGVHAVAELIHMDHSAHGTNSDDQSCITLRRYAGMALTNLTFGDDNNKALLCSFRDFMVSLVSQLSSMSDDLRQVTASVLRNLSWRADSNSKQTLREVGAVIGLMKAAMEGKKESTLKSILSALWNLSAHCSTNKVDICAMEGALAFLVDMLSYKAPSKTLSIIENAGGILRNVSNHIAMREDYREIVRERGCLQVLLRQLRSPSLTVVSNACGTLWNLSARCPQDQRLLWDLGAVPMLRSLVHSKHRMISMGSSAALKNLLSARPSGSNLVHLDSTARGLGLSTLPSLAARRQRALEQEIDQNLSETCENIEPSTSPTTKDDKFLFKVDGNPDINSRRGIYNSLSRPNPVPRSESRESMRSITSTHSDTIFERVNRHVNNNLTSSDIKQQSLSLHSAMGFNVGQIGESSGKTGNQLEKKYAMRFKNTIGLRPEVSDGAAAATTSTMSWTTGPDQESSSVIINRLPVDDNDKLSPTDSIKSTAAAGAATINSSGDFINKSLASPTSPTSGATNLFGDYAETDLDQPTNYSLRYAERNLEDDDDAGGKQGEYFQTEQDIEDTIKTYYTEGTPRETSLNSSRAASHSDLQDEKTKQSRVDRKMLVKRLTLPPSSLEIQLGSKKIDEDTGRSTSDDVDDDKIKVDCQLKVKVKKQNCGVESGECFTESSMASDADDDDEDLLAACIHIGMQNNRHRQSFRRNSLEKGARGESNLTRYQTSIALDQVEDTQNYDKTTDNLKLQTQSDDDDELNIKINHNTNTRDETNDFTSFEHNLHKIDEKIPTELEKLNSTTKNSSSIHSNDENSMDESSTTTTTGTAATGETAINQKLLHEQSETPIETMSCESMESYDSVERSEHVLLELCIKSGKNTDKLADKKDTDITDGGNSNKSDEMNIRTKKNDTNEIEYRRQRDPDAMIASLDRLTATLVQQTEAMRERDSSIMKQSTQSDTWNEDSPNESFPTITVSLPLVNSFKTDSDDSGQQNLKKKIDSDDLMTTSCIIEREAFKLADAVNAELQSNSLTFNDDNIDSIKPPSAMNSLLSLTTSYASTETNINSINDGNPLIGGGVIKNPRKKSLPIGVVAKRAISHSYQPQSGSLESLLFNETNISNLSQLDNVKPPSMMDDLILELGGDMENSMISVSSITSEIADAKDHHHNRIFDKVAGNLKLNDVNIISLNDYLDNINPPSLINEISDIDDTTIDANTDTMCSDTLCIDNDFDIYPPNIILNEKINDDDDDSDDGATQMTECSSGLSSSAESTPKKNKHLTPKQKRQLAKDRYRTYTIAGEIVKKEAEERRKNIQINGSSGGSGNYSALIKLTPKQRRQEDRARFQTQVVDNPFGECAEKLINNAEEKEEMAGKVSKSLVKSGIPSLKNCAGNLKTGKRIDNHERYRTHKIEDGNLQTMLEKNANIVLHSLNETGNKIDDSILDNETISLVSNNSEAERSLRCNESVGASKFLTFTRKTSVQTAGTRTPESEVRIESVPQFVSEEKIAVNEINASDSESEEENVCQPAVELPKRPRIIKPPMSRDTSGDSNSGAEKSEPQNSPKGIRGKRKSLYTNPNARKLTPQCSPIKTSNNIINSGIPIGRSNSSPIVRATRATTLRQSTNGPTNKNDISKPIVAPTRFTVNKNSTITKRSSIPQRGLTSLPLGKTVKRHSTPPSCAANTKEKVETPKPLERQGTFTKDESEVENAPTVVVGSPLKSKIAKPTRNSPSKNSIIPKTKITVKKTQVSQQSGLTKCASAEGITSKTTTTTTIPTTAYSKRLSVVENGRTDGGNKKTSLGQRSNSNSSIVPQNLQATSGVGKKPTKEATSKIASLWKKVEENRNKQRFEKPDTRQWITAPPSATNTTDSASATSDGVDSVETNFRLFRSSTFEGVPKQTDDDDVGETRFNRSSTTKHIDSKHKYGMSYRTCDLSSVSANGTPCKIPRFGETNVSNTKTTTPTKNIGYGTIVLRKQRSIDSMDGEITKRISRLGSFVRVESDIDDSSTRITSIVPPYNCLTKIQDDATIPTVDNHGCLTASTQVTSV